MIRKVLIAVMATMLLLSCNSSSSGIYKLGKRVVVSTESAKVVHLSPTDSLTGEYMNSVWGIHAILDSIAILDLYESSHHFRALNLVNKQFTDFLMSGRGPGEIITAYFSTARREGEHSFIDIVAMNEDCLLTLDLEETLRQGRAAVIEKNNILPQASPSFLIGGDKILSEVFFDEDIYSMKLYDKTSLEILQTVQLFGNERYLADYQPLFASTRRIKPDGTRISMSMACFDEINIYDIFGDNHLSISTAKKCLDERVVKESIRNRSLFRMAHYKDQDVTDERIYAIHCPDDNDSREGAVIHVFTWEGDLIGVYEMAESLIGIAISERENALYGLSSEEVLYKYRF